MDDFDIAVAKKLGMDPYTDEYKEFLNKADDETTKEYQIWTVAFDEIYGTKEKI